MTDEALALAVKNRAVSRCYSKWMMPAQVGGLLCVLCWPLGAVAGSLGIVALVAMGAGTAVSGLLMAGKESQGINQGDSEVMARYLLESDLDEFQEMAAAIKKLVGTAEEPETMQETASGSNAQTAPGSASAEAVPDQPTPGPEPDVDPKSGDAVPDQPTPEPEPFPESGDAVPYAPIKLDPDCPHFLLLAGSREGKTNALRCLLDGYQRVNYISTKATDQIPQHWDGYVIQGQAKSRGKQLQWILKTWGDKLSAHAALDDTEPEWFVFDEAIQMQTYAKRSGIRGLSDNLAGLQMEIATQGAAIGAYGVLMAQTKNAGPLKIDLDILQQNFRMVIPLKSKRRLALSVVEKMGGLRLTPEQQEDILTNPNRYFQLWLGEDEDVYHDVLPEYQGTLKPLLPCPEYEPEQADQDGAGEYVAVPEKTPEQKVVAWLDNNPGWHTVATIKKSVRPLPDWEKPAVQALLERLWDDGLIDASDEKYGATGTPP